MSQSRWVSTVLTLTFLSSMVPAIAVPHHALARSRYRPPTPTRPVGTSGSTATRGYRPPSPSRPGRTGSTATRGVCEESALTVLAPLNHLARTSTTTPTFVWFMGELEPHRIEISVFDYANNRRGQKIETFELQSQPGKMQWTVPADRLKLAYGRTYLWQVALICNPNRPSQNQWVETVFEVVELPTELKTAITQTNDPLQRATAYAEAGFWYDALAATLQSATAAAKTYRAGLLQDLSQLESAEQRSRLEAVINSDR